MLVLRMCLTYICFDANTNIVHTNPSTTMNLHPLFLLSVSAEVTTGSQQDVVKVARQILNRGSAHRTVSKQECVVELTELPLVLCSETTETINLSGGHKLSLTIIMGLTVCPFFSEIYDL